MPVYTHPVAYCLPTILGRQRRCNFFIFSCDSAQKAALQSGRQLLQVWDGHMWKGFYSRENIPVCCCTETHISSLWASGTHSTLTYVYAWFIAMVSLTLAPATVSCKKKKTTKNKSHYRGMRGFFLLKIAPIAVEIHLWIINELRFQRNIQRGVTHTAFQSAHDF